MSIWYKAFTLAEVIAVNDINMQAHLGLELLELGEDFLRGRLPVDERTKQPFGTFHGGASVVLAETLGSIAANLVLNPDTHFAVGLEINANHLHTVRSGWVNAVARPVHLGRSTQVWDIRLHDDDGKPVAISRLTMSVLSRR